MNNSVKWVIGAAVAMSVMGSIPATTVLASAATSPAKMQTMSMVNVSKVYPESATQVGLAAGDTMAFKGKTITLKATNTMGMVKMGTPFTATYDAMKKGFVLTDGKMLTPGVTYSVHATWANLSMKHDSFTIPDLLQVKQIAKNQVELVYDKKVDSMSATSPGNFWVKSDQTMESGIAELGKNDRVTPTNGLTKARVIIKEDGMSGRKFIFTFTSDISAGVKYTLIPCNVDAANLSGYAGPNVTSASTNSFVGHSEM